MSWLAQQITVKYGIAEPLMDVIGEESIGSAAVTGTRDGSVCHNYKAVRLLMKVVPRNVLSSFAGRENFFCVHAILRSYTKGSFLPGDVC